MICTVAESSTGMAYWLLWQQCYGSVSISYGSGPGSGPRSRRLINYEFAQIRIRILPPLFVAVENNCVVSLFNINIEKFLKFLPELFIVI